MQRRHCLLALSSFLAAGHVRAQLPDKPSFDNLKVIIPGGKGGGWDQTARALGAAMQVSGVVKNLTYVNIGGQGGQLGLLDYRAKYQNDPNALLMGGMVMVGATSQFDAVTDMQSIQPLARLTADYSILCVSSKSSIKDVDGLFAAMKKNIGQLRFAGGSRGGVDHMVSVLMALASKNKANALQYTPYSSGEDVVRSLLGGESEIGVSGYSEFKVGIEAQQIRPIAISKMSSQFGYPSLRPYGVDVDLNNWRGVFTGKDVAAAAQKKLLAAVEWGVNHEHWKASLASNRWEPAWQADKDFAQFIVLQKMMAQSMAYLLKHDGKQAAA